MRRRPPGVRGERGEAGSEGSTPGWVAGKWRAGVSGVDGARGDSGGPAAAGAEPMSSEERGVEASVVDEGGERA